MYFDPSVYNIENLRPEDKKELELIEDVKTRLLSRDSVDVFVNDRDIMGSTLQGIYRDILIEYVKYLNEQLEYYKVDMIMNKIDGYPKEELRRIMTARIPQTV